MSFTQVRDALETIRGLYREFLSQVKRVPETDERLVEFAERVFAAEQRMSKAVSRVMQSGDEATLNIWLQFFPDTEIAALEEKLPDDDLKSVDALTRYYSTMNEQLVGLFELMSRSTECQKAQAVFDELATVQQQNARDIFWSERDPT